MELLADHTVCREGEMLSANQAAVLRIFDVKMAAFRMRLLACWTADGARSRCACLACLLTYTLIPGARGSAERLQQHRQSKCTASQVVACSMQAVGLWRSSMSLQCRTMQVERKQSGQLLLAWRSDHLAFEVVCCTCVLSDVLSNI